MNVCNSNCSLGQHISFSANGNITRNNNEINSVKAFKYGDKHRRKHRHKLHYTQARIAAQLNQ